MSYIQSKDDTNGQTVDLYYEDWGQGAPVVLIHGWPLDHQMWEYQSVFLARNGLRVIAYDRRGFGKSSKPWARYDYDTLADDLKAVLDGLDLQDVTLVGFSMGGGEVARYMSRHGGARVGKVAFVSAVTPYLLKTDGNPDGVPGSTFDGMIENLEKDRADFLHSFPSMFYGSGLLGSSVSKSAMEWFFQMAMPASPKATIDCVESFGKTDFRQDIPTIKVSALIIHGDSDKTVPAAHSADQLAKLLPAGEYLVYEGAPHGLHLTDKDKLNRDLLAFANNGTTR